MPPAIPNVFTGSDGTLTLAFEDTPEGQDARIVLEFYEMQTVARVTDVEVYVRTDLQEYHEIGQRHATSLRPGNIHISGRIGRAYVNGGLLNLLLGRGTSSTQREPYVQPVFNMVLQLRDPAVPDRRVEIELNGVKMENWALSLPEEDFVMENATFRALRIFNRGRTGAEAGGGSAEAPQFPTDEAVV